VAVDFARLGCPETTIVRNGIPPAPDLPAEALQSLRQQLKVGSRLLVVVTATNFYLKGVAKVLEALVRLGAVDRKKFLVVVTGQAQSDVFQNYIDRHQLGDDCRLLGWVPQIDDYYQAADIFLHPTYHDAGSLSTLKALAAGRAVVTSRFDGSADWITDGTNGLILKEPADAGEIAETLMRLTDDDRRQRLGLAARELAPRIHQEHQFSKLEELYGRIRPSPRRTK
jgi:UDP-glucose:(heptosyl)LPS alpha-1,3-glucosyltransferase